MNLDQVKDSLRRNSLSVLFFWAKGCPACQQTKPAYEFLKNKYPENNLLDLEFNDETFPFYSQFAEKVVVEEPILDENEENVLDDEGVPKFQIKYDEEGQPVKQTKIVVPCFVVFSHSEATDDNPYGMISRLDGYNHKKLARILQAFSLKERGVF